MTLPRTDCAMGFEGDTTFAYPLMIQLQSAIANYPKAVNRSHDLVDLKGNILNFWNDMLKYKSDYEIPDTSFLFGGYSWKTESSFSGDFIYEKHDKMHIDQFLSGKELKEKLKYHFLAITPKMQSKD